MSEKIFCLLPVLLSLLSLNAQIDEAFIRDSIEIERGISGTTDFEPFF